jgi:hypothetical protein
MGYVPLVVAVGSQVVSPRLGEFLEPGDPRNPFSTTRALLMERWVAAWAAMGAPDALSYLLPLLRPEDLVNVLKVWRALLNVPTFVQELRELQVRCTSEWFGRHMRSLHVRILLLIMSSRVIRLDILHADQLKKIRVSFPFFLQPHYEVAAEITLTGKLHPWLRPAFMMNPAWLNRRSRWCMTALHTLMCIMYRLRSIHRPWICQVAFMQPLSELAMITRVPVGHSSAVQPVLRRGGLYVDPTVTALLPSAATNMISAMRNSRFWHMYALHNTTAALETPGGLRALVQWRSWRLVPDTEPPSCFIDDEPLYTTARNTTKKSCVLAHTREVHFEMYRRWINMPKRQLEIQPDHLFDAIMGPLEDYIQTRLGPCFDWMALQINPLNIAAHTPAASSPHTAFFADVAAVFSQALLAVELEEK